MSHLDREGTLAEMAKDEMCVGTAELNGEKIEALTRDGDTSEISLLVAANVIGPLWKR
jgi:hypothetical protein